MAFNSLTVPTQMDDQNSPNFLSLFSQARPAVYVVDLPREFPNCCHPVRTPNITVPETLQVPELFWKYE